MERRGLSVSETARSVKQELPGGAFNKANISHYLAGRSTPRPKFLKALCRVLGVDAKELIEARASLSTNNSTNTGVRVHLADLPDGEALLRINQKLSWVTVIRISKSLKEDI
jgi:transcriptional regulator with XRE-family HTH domain